MSCGDVVTVPLTGQPGMHIGIKTLSRTQEGYLANGFLIGQSAVAITAPVSILMPSKEKVSLKERKELNTYKKMQFAIALERSKTDFSFRQELRKQQLACLLNKEVQLALKSKLSRRSFTLGMCQFDTDLEIFQMDFFTKRKSVFCYMNHTLQSLDPLLGRKWDILVSGERVKFVTKLSVSLTISDTLHVTLFSSVFYGTLTNNYRETLATDISLAGNRSSAI